LSGRTWTRHFLKNVVMILELWEMGPCLAGQYLRNTF
jgi:hypothetical protein